MIDTLDDRKSRLSEPLPETIPASDRRPGREISGRFVVLILLCLGIVTTSIMFVYWERHTRPFRALRTALGREFRYSRPNVEGGRQKGRGDWTLRISMTVNFPPAEDSEKTSQLIGRVRQLIQEKQDLTQVKKIEINLIQFIPQEHAKTYSVALTPEELIEE